MDEPYAVMRITRLKPGQSLVYYKGHFESDIERCSPIDSEVKGVNKRSKAMRYASLLCQVRDAAEKMDRDGAAWLSKRTISIPLKDRMVQDEKTGEMRIKCFQPVSVNEYKITCYEAGESVQSSQSS